MDNRNLSELSLEEITKVTGGTLDDMNKQSLDLMIKLFKEKRRKMEEVYQFRDLPDEQREYFRQRWYQV